MRMHPDGRFWFASGVQRSFGLKELDEPWIQVGLRRSKTSVALGGSVLGWTQMRHWVTQASAEYTTNGVKVGLGAEFWMLKLQNPYQNDRAAVVQSHIHKAIRDDLHLAARVQNVIGSNWMVGGDPIERIVDIDFFHTPHPNVSMRGGLSVSDQFPIDYRGALAWKAHDILVLSLGVGTMPSRIEMGMRFDRSGYHSGISLAKITNEPLGWRQNYWIGRLVK